MNILLKHSKMKRFFLCISQTQIKSVRKIKINSNKINVCLSLYEKMLIGTIVFRREEFYCDIFYLSGILLLNIL